MKRKWTTRRKWNLLILLVMVLPARARLGDHNCPPDKNYLCQEGKCIPKEYVCNDHKDCRDGDDETDCGKKKIYFFSLIHWKFISADLKLCRGDDFFKCREDGKCISRSLTCDLNADCSDGSDEGEELCSKERVALNITRKPCHTEKEFECEAKICIPKNLVCDGTKHCLDGRDEDPKLCADKTVSSATESLS